MSEGILLAGAAKTEITPHELVGLNAMGDSFDAVHDPIYVRALVLDDGTTVCAVIAADLIEVGDTKSVRQLIETETEVPAGNVLIAPSHSHNAPRIGLVPPGGKARVPTPESLRYTEDVYEAMVETVRRARAAAQPATVGFGRGYVDVNVNRDEYVGGGCKLGYNPDGPSDKTLAVFAFQSMAGQPIALLTNYAVHSTTTLGTAELGADLAGVAATYIEDQLGVGAVALWTSGALGDQAPRVALGDPTGDRERDRRLAYGAAQAQGMLIGATALRATQAIGHYTGDARIATGHRVVACPVRRLEVPPGMEQADVDTVELTLSCVVCGDVALAGVSGEVTVPVYRALRQASPLTNTLVVSNANARIGYLPDDEAYTMNTVEAGGCPIPEGYVQKTIVTGLRELIAAALGN